MSQENAQYRKVNWSGQQFPTVGQYDIVGDVSAHHVSAPYSYVQQPLTTERFPYNDFTTNLSSVPRAGRDVSTTYPAATNIRVAPEDRVPQAVQGLAISDAPSLVESKYEGSRVSGGQPRTIYGTGTKLIDETEAGAAEADVAIEDVPRPMTAAELRSHQRKMKRFRLTHSQTRFLMTEFARQAHPDATHRERLAQHIPGWSARQVQVWFQNRRAKMKRSTNDDRERPRVVVSDVNAMQTLHPPYIAPANISDSTSTPRRSNTVTGGALSTDGSTTGTTSRQRSQTETYVQHDHRFPSNPDVRHSEGHANAPLVSAIDTTVPRTSTCDDEICRPTQREAGNPAAYRYYKYTSQYTMSPNTGDTSSSTPGSARLATSWEAAFDGLRSFTSEQTQAQNRARSLSEIAALYEVAAPQQDQGLSTSTAETWSTVANVDNSSQNVPLYRQNVYQASHERVFQHDTADGSGVSTPGHGYTRFTPSLYAGSMNQQFQFPGSNASMHNAMSSTSQLENAQQHQSLPYQSAGYATPTSGMQPQSTSMDEPNSAHMFASHSHPGANSGMMQAHDYWGDSQRG